MSTSAFIELLLGIGCEAQPCALSHPRLLNPSHLLPTNTGPQGVCCSEPPGICSACLNFSVHSPCQSPALRISAGRRQCLANAICPGLCLCAFPQALKSHKQPARTRLPALLHSAEGNGDLQLFQRGCLAFDSFCEIN